MNDPVFNLQGVDPFNEKWVNQVEVIENNQEISLPVIANEEMVVQENEVGDNNNNSLVVVAREIDPPNFPVASQVYYNAMNGTTDGERGVKRIRVEDVVVEQMDLDAFLQDINVSLVQLAEAVTKEDEVVPK